MYSKNDVEMVSKTLTIELTEKKASPEQMKKAQKSKSPFAEYLTKFSSWGMGYEYQGRSHSTILKEHTIDNMTAKLFFEKNSTLVSWNDKMHEKINFVLNVLLDFLGMIAKAFGELLPSRVELF
mmetsp:Transcript_20811/g.18200  ORF Transcript_20811/g.18200 Transcript_20811/m.18200 type:complete len:124 (+) Transcript_20811:27-398(+)